MDFLANRREPLNGVVEMTFCCCDTLNSVIILCVHSFLHPTHCHAAGTVRDSESTQKVSPLNWHLFKRL